MLKVFYVEKKQGFDIEAKGLLNDFKENLKIESLKKVRILNKYIIKGKKIKNVENIIFDPVVDILYEKEDFLNKSEMAFACEYLPGQYDQRSDAANQCYAILNQGENVEFKTAKVIILDSKVSDNELEKIKKYYINPVDSREVYFLDNNFESDEYKNNEIEIISDFINFTIENLKDFHKKYGLAMSIEDLILVKDYFLSEERNPTETEIKVIDTYWSDHCRHTTFNTCIKSLEIEDGKYSNIINDTFKDYIESRKFVYEEKINKKDITLMDLAVISMKEMRKSGILNDLDESDEINACSIEVKIETNNGIEDYILMFKNETHNHPTEIEPFGGAATCLGGAIRDPLSGRSYVYQAMRITGSADPTVGIEKTLEGKLPQRLITLGAAKGYSSYGNQIGLATGEVREIYNDGYMAKRMEVGAVLGAAPKENIIREVPSSGDVVILLGGRTGRDGCGGATGSSKQHTEKSINECGAQVQKGNPPTERKIQRLFRNKKATTLIKRCNDFGAGGVSVAIGELSDSLDIDLDKVPKKYSGLNGTELAISESQERMAVVVKNSDAIEFINYANDENLEATIVAKITDTGYMRMFWNQKLIVNLKRSFLDTNGAKQFIDVVVKAINKESFFKDKIDQNTQEKIVETLTDLNVSLQKGLVERFDSTIGSNTVLMPYGGKYRLTPAEGMACKIPVLNGESKHCSLMSSGYNPEISIWSPFHGAYYAVIESVSKIVAMGGDYKKIRLTLQEYFEKLGHDKEKWGNPFAALLGAYRAQKDLNIPAIGGKDSMSGTFEDITVPPTVVSFAVAVENSDFIKSPEFKDNMSKIIYLKVERDENDLLDMIEYKNMLEKINKLNKDGLIKSIYSIKTGGAIEAIAKMALGNKIGFELSKDIDKNLLFEKNYGSLIVEIDLNINLNIDNAIVLGKTIKEEKIYIDNNIVFSVEDIKTLLSEKLNNVFIEKTKDVKNDISNISFSSNEVKRAKNKVEHPKVIIPIFPGTNCEYDSKRAFEKAGAVVTEVVFNNLNEDKLEESIKKLEMEIKQSQIIMLAGGFSAGDEPDGSAKFIATVFRNEKIKNAVEELLNEREGLILGVCNGFQALIKLGLVPYGKILDPDDSMPTLTYNTIGRHMSSIIQTKVASNLSPWLSKVSVGDVHNIPISHGEGRFVGSEDVIKELMENGQVATQYVDFSGDASLNMPYNPNGSMYGIEAITNKDGRVLGKMGHSERIGENLYKNIDGTYDQKIFEAGVDYFRLGGK
ncbi:MAG: phosphoribosylformylglycinamidine synthase [Sarcina sp.]